MKKLILTAAVAVLGLVGALRATGTTSAPAAASDCCETSGACCVANAACCAAK